MIYTEITTPSGETIIQGTKEDNSFVQFFPDPSNSDYQAYLAWKAEQPSA